MTLTKTELFSRKAHGGLFAATLFPSTTIGEIFFVDSTNSNASDATTHGYSPESPFATIDYAIGRATDSAGDVIFVAPHHTETITTAITMDKIGLSIIGLGHGLNRPLITPNGVIDAVTMTAAKSMIANIMFAAPGTSLQTADINIAAAYCSIINTRHIVSGTLTTKVNTITLTAAASNALIKGVRIYQSVVEATGGGIAIEGALANLEIDDVYMFCTGGFGFALGALYDGATATGVYIHDSVFMNDKVDTVCVELGNNPKGLMAHVGINGRHTTLASNMTISTGLAYHQTYAVEEGGVSGYVCPAVDAE